jgi:hypothetical protein
VTLSDASQGSTTADASFTGGTDCVDIGASIGTTTTVQFTIAAATPFNFSGSLSSSGVQSEGQGRVSYSLARTSSPSATIFDQTQGLSPNISGTLQPGTYQYRVHGDASNDFACSKSGTETDSFNYNVHLNVGTAPPSNTSPPSISGTPAVGNTLTCLEGSWTNSPTGFTYQWNRDGAPIAGATGQTYVVQAADQGHTLTCTVTASNAAGSSSPSTSAGLLVPLPPAAAAAKCRLSSTGKVKVVRTKGSRRRRPSISGGTLPVRVTCDEAAAAKLAGNLSDTPPRKRHGPKPRTKHFRLATINTTVRAGVTAVLNLKLSATQVKDLLHGAKESADLTLTANNANGAGRATARISRLRT